jgi:hypothetical protein
MKTSIFAIALMAAVGFTNAQSLAEQAPSPAKIGQKTHQTKSNPQISLARTSNDTSGSVSEVAPAPKESSVTKKQESLTHATSSGSTTYLPSTMAIDAR